MLFELLRVFLPVFIPVAWIKKDHFILKFGVAIDFLPACL